MHTDPLRALLRRLSQEPSAPDDVAAARSALRSHPLGEGLDVSTLLTDDVRGDALALLAVLDETEPGEPLGLREALLHDVDAPGGPADVAASVMAALFGPTAQVPVSEAVRAEAAPVPELAAGFDPRALPVAEAVVHEAGVAPELALGFDPSALPVAQALVSEAGSVDLLDAIMATVAPAAVSAVAPVVDEALPEGWLTGLLDRALTTEQHMLAVERLGTEPRLRTELAAHADVGRLLRESLIAEAGKVASVWPQVAPAIGVDDPDRVPGWDEAALGHALRAEAGSVDVVDRVMLALSRDLAPADVTDVPEAANDRWWPMLGVVAAAAVALMTLLPVLMPDDADTGFQERPVDFASADEINVDAVRYGENASVFVQMPTTDDEPVIIWVDDGGSL